MNNLERKIMASRGYKLPFKQFNFSVDRGPWRSKPSVPPPEGYEYYSYQTAHGYTLWKLRKLPESDTLLKKRAPDALKALLTAGAQPGTTEGALGAVASQAIDMVRED